MDINKTLAEEFKLRQEQIDNTVALLDDDKTIPFIARYRKELTGSLDDQVLREIADRLTYLRNLEKRKGEIISSITEQEKMTDEIMSAIENAKTLVEVEDIYRPFKPKRKTRASVAREKGLEPLAELILTQDKKCDPQVEGSKFINEEKGVKSADEALQGAMDIIAEDISDDADLRKYIRTLFSQITSNQIEAARIAMTRYIKRGGQVWIKIFPDKPATRKPLGTRMGKGKGAPEYWVAVVKPGRVMFEIAGVPEETAREAMRLAMHKLPIKCKFVKRDTQETGGEQ